MAPKLYGTRFETRDLCREAQELSGKISNRHHDAEASLAYLVAELAYRLADAEAEIARLRDEVLPTLT